MTSATKTANGATKFSAKEAALIATANAKARASGKPMAADAIAKKALAEAADMLATMPKGPAREAAKALTVAAAQRKAKGEPEPAVVAFENMPAPVAGKKAYAPNQYDHVTAPKAAPKAKAAKPAPKAAKVDPATTPEAIDHAAHVLTAPAAKAAKAAEAKAAKANAAKLAQPKPAPQPKPLAHGSGAAVGVAAGAMEGQPHTKQAVREARQREAAKRTPAPQRAPLPTPAPKAAKPAPKAVPAPKAAKAQPAPTTSQRKRGQASGPVPADAKIVIVAKASPYRPDSKADVTFAMFAKAKTVAKAREIAAANAGTYDIGHLRYASRDGFIAFA